MNTKILVSTDFSEVSYEAGRLAHETAKHDGAELALLHVVPQLHNENFDTIPVWLRAGLQAPDDVQKLARTALATKAAELSKEGVVVSTYLDEGETWAAIVRRAEAIGATLIVVGSHGRTGLSRMLLGSVAEQVVRHAHSPVLVARSGPAEGPVVTGTDMSEAARPGLREAARLAAATNSALHVIHVLDLGLLGRSPFSINLDGIAAAMADTESTKESEQALDAEIALATKGLDVKVTREVAVGDAATVLVERAQDKEARLVVTSTHGRTGLRRALIGSVAERIVRLAHTSVLVVRGIEAPAARA